MRAAGLIGGGSPDPTQVGHHPCAGGGITHGAPWRSRVVTFFCDGMMAIKNMNSPNFGRNFEVNDDDWIWFILIYLTCSCRCRKVVKKVVHLRIGWGYTATNLPHFLRMSKNHEFCECPCQIALAPTHFPAILNQASGIIHGPNGGWSVGPWMSLARGLPMRCTASTTLCRSFPKKRCDARAAGGPRREMTWWPFWGGKVPKSFWTWEEKDYKGLCLFRSFWLSFNCSCISFDCFLPPCF